MESKSIVFVCRNHIESIPPILNSVFILAEMGHRISVISTFIEDDMRELLSNKYNVKFYLMGKIIRGKNLFVTFKNNILFRLFALNKIKALSTSCDTFWLSGAGTAISLYKAHYIKKIKYIFSCHELYGHSLLNRLIVEDFMRYACLNVVPEVNRAQIYRHWFKLKKTPFILPNKTTSLYKRIKNLYNKNYNEKTDKIIKEIRNAAKGRKIVLYQGGINKMREISKVVVAVKELSHKFYFVLMGKRSKYVEELKNLLPELYYIDYIPYPFHLKITESADIGILSYDYSRLNHIYCAPNKIYEYSMFGLPMLCNDVAGLIFTIEAAKAGLCVDFSNVDKIVSALQQLDDNYEEFSNNSSIFYKSIDMLSLHLNLVDKI